MTDDEPASFLVPRRKNGEIRRVTVFLDNESSTPWVIDGTGREANEAAKALGEHLGLEDSSAGGDHHTYDLFHAALFTPVRASRDGRNRAHVRRRA